MSLLPRYAKRLKRQVTIRLDHGTIAYFKALSEETGFGITALSHYRFIQRMYRGEGAERGRTSILETFGVNQCRD